MDDQKFEFLYEFIPSLKVIIERSNLTDEQSASLDYIYEYFKSDKNDFNKNDFRVKARLMRKGLDSGYIKEKSMMLSKVFLESGDFKKAKTIFSYISFDSEIKTFSVLTECLKHGKRLAVPKIINGRMALCEISSLENFEENKFGILEPQVYQEISKEEIDLAVVPGIAFNSLGYRIGYGKGFYDNRYSCE
jgi:5-formyltetrahydrofolate cyclo-ligase